MWGRGILVAGFGLVCVQAGAHPGGLDASGCHHDRKRGGYHCHRTAEPRQPLRAFGGGEEVYYRNCSVARAAGAAPVRVGQPGYAPHLDRDGDGVGCE